MDMPNLRTFTQVALSPLLSAAAALMSGCGGRQPLRAATPGAGTPTLVNVTRVENFGAQYVHWVEVTMNAQDPEVFRFEQRIIDANRFPRSPFARLRLRLQDEARQRIGFSSTPFPSSLPQAVGIIAWVVNEHHVKTVPGRKTTIADAQWLATLARAGLLRASFIPPVDFRQLRLVTRQRQKLGGCAAPGRIGCTRCWWTRGYGSTWWWPPSTAPARAMVKALIEGQPMHQVLDKKGRLRASREEFFEALSTEQFSAAHRFVAEEILQHIEQIEQRIARMDHSTCWRA
jgi:hypothetical protein